MSPLIYEPSNRNSLRDVLASKGAVSQKKAQRIFQLLKSPLFVTVYFFLLSCLFTTTFLVLSAIDFSREISPTYSLETYIYADGTTWDYKDYGSFTMLTTLNIVAGLSLLFSTLMLSQTSLLWVEIVLKSSPSPSTARALKIYSRAIKVVSVLYALIVIVLLILDRTELAYALTLPMLLYLLAFFQIGAFKMNSCMYRLFYFYNFYLLIY